MICLKFLNELAERDCKLVEFYIDLMTKGGFVGLGYTPTRPDAIITLSAKRFQKLLTQETAAVREYPKGNIDIEGDLTKAQQLDNALRTLASEYKGVDILNLPQYCM